MTAEEEELYNIIRWMYRADKLDYHRFREFMRKHKLCFQKIDQYRLGDHKGSDLVFILDYKIKDLLFCVKQYNRMKNFQ